MNYTELLCFKKVGCLLFFTLFLNLPINAQGDGPLFGLLSPTGVFGIATKYVNLSTHLSPATVLVKQADLLIQKRKVQQQPLFQLETHLSYNLSKKIWMAVNLHYQLGGSTHLVGEKQDNQINIQTKR